MHQILQSDFRWSRKVFQDHPPNQNIYCVNVDGLGRPSETIQNLILMHKLIWISAVFYSVGGVRKKSSYASPKHERALCRVKPNWNNTVDYTYSSLRVMKRDSEFKLFTLSSMSNSLNLGDKSVPPRTVCVISFPKVRSHLT